MPSRSTRRRRARGRPAHHRRNQPGARPTITRFAADGPSVAADHRVPSRAVIAATLCLGLSAGLALSGLVVALPVALNALHRAPSPIPVGLCSASLGLLITLLGSKLPRQLATWLMRQVLRDEPGSASTASATRALTRGRLLSPEYTKAKVEGWTDRQLRWITFAIICLTLGVLLAATPFWLPSCLWIYERLHEAFVWSDPFLAVLVAVIVAAVELPAFLMLGMALACLGRLLNCADRLWRWKMIGCSLAGAAAGALAAGSIFTRLPATMFPALAALPALGVALVCAYRVESIRDAAGPARVQKGTTNDVENAALAQTSESRTMGLHRLIPYPRMGRARPVATSRSADSRRRLTA